MHSGGAPADDRRQLERLVGRDLWTTAPQRGSDLRHLDGEVGVVADGWRTGPRLEAVPGALRPSA